MQSLCLKTACLVTLSMVTLAFILTPDAESAGMKTVATDIIYGGAVGALVGTGVSLLEDNPDWDKNLRRGTGIGIILGLGFGIYDGFVRASHRERYALLNVESRQIAWSLPRLVMTAADQRAGLYDFRFDALRYRF